jgi:hypothetical protein
MVGRRSMGGILSCGVLNKCEKKILAKINRCVIFDTGKHSLHGHPYPLACPENRRRNSLAVYYYVVDRPADQNYDGQQPNVTWVPVTDTDKKDRRMQEAKSVKSVVKQFIPPILLDAI